jgi:hypothetical protein
MIRVKRRGNVSFIKRVDEEKIYAREVRKQQERRRKQVESGECGQVIDLVVPNQKPEHLAAIAERIEKQKRLDALRDQYREAAAAREHSRGCAR